MATALVQGPTGGVTVDQVFSAWGSQPFAGSCYGTTACSITGGGAPASSLQQQLQLQRRYSGGMAAGGGGGSSERTAARSAPPPAAALAARQQQLQQQQQQQQAGALQRPRSRGCQHCVSCLGVRRYCPSAAALARARRGGPAVLQDGSSPAAEEWWPSGLATPTIYFQLRRRQLHLQYKTSATAAASVKLWRPTSATQNVPSALLARRGLRPLGLLIPTTFTNVQQNDSRVQLIGIKDAPAWAPAHAPSSSLPASTSASISAGTAAANRQLSMLLCCSDDLPLLRRTSTPPTAPPAHCAAAEPLNLVEAASEAGAAGSQHSLAAHLLQRVSTLSSGAAACSSSPAKRTRLGDTAAAACPAARLPSPFALPTSQQEQAAGAWWLQQPAPQQQQQQQQQQQHLAQLQATQQQQVEQPWWLQQTQPKPCSNPLSQAVSPECCMLASAGSGRSSMCLSSSMSIGSDGLPAFHPVNSATSVLPYASPYPAAAPQQVLAEQHQQQQYQYQQQHCQQQQQQQQQELYLQRAAARAYPVVIDLPKQPNEGEAEISVLSSLLRLLKRKAD